jgi:glycogen synthase
VNLLAHRVADIVFEEGARFSVAADQGGLARVERALEQILEQKGYDPEAVTIDDFRLLFHEGWGDLLDLVCPSDTHTRVTDRFQALVFS